MKNITWACFIGMLGVVVALLFILKMQDTQIKQYQKIVKRYEMLVPEQQQHEELIYKKYDARIRNLQNKNNELTSIILNYENLVKGYERIVKEYIEEH